jgi:hypothetical protein
MLLFFALAAVVQLAPDAPNQQPWLAADGKQVVLAFGAANQVYVSSSTDEGQTFTTPVRIPINLKVALGRHRGPRIALAGNSIVVSAIGGATGVRGQDGDLLAWRSSDGGKTWSEPVRVNDVASSAREGLHGMATRGNRLFASWLDLRKPGTQIYGAWSSDGGATWSKNVLVYQSPDGTVCQCCHPTVTISDSGEIYVMFRNALDGSRDMYVAKSTDGGKSFGSADRLGSGTWKLNACPMDGGAIAVTGGKVATAFRRDKTIVLASDSKNETAVGEGRDPVIVASPRGNFLAWNSAEGISVLEAGQSKSRLLGPEGKYVHLVATPRGTVIAAWEHQGGIEVRRLTE